MMWVLDLLGYSNITSISLRVAKIDQIKGKQLHFLNLTIFIKIRLLNPKFYAYT